MTSLLKNQRPQKGFHWKSRRLKIVLIVCVAEATEERTEFQKKTVMPPKTKHTKTPLKQKSTRKTDPTAARCHKED